MGVKEFGRGIEDAALITVRTPIGAPAIAVRDTVQTGANLLRRGANIVKKRSAEISEAFSHRPFPYKNFEEITKEDKFGKRRKKRMKNSGAAIGNAFKRTGNTLEKLFVASPKAALYTVSMAVGLTVGNGLNGVKDVMSSTKNLLFNALNPILEVGNQGKDKKPFAFHKLDKNKILTRDEALALAKESSAKKTEKKEKAKKGETDKQEEKSEEKNEEGTDNAPEAKDNKKDAVKTSVTGVSTPDTNTSTNTSNSTASSNVSKDTKESEKNTAKGKIIIKNNGTVNDPELKGILESSANDPEKVSAYLKDKLSKKTVYGAKLYDKLLAKGYTIILDTSKLGGKYDGRKKEITISGKASKSGAEHVWQGEILFENDEMTAYELSHEMAHDIFNTSYSKDKEFKEFFGATYNAKENSGRSFTSLGITEHYAKLSSGDKVKEDLTELINLCIWDPKVLDEHLTSLISTDKKEGRIYIANEETKNEILNRIKKAVENAVKA